MLHLFNAQFNDNQKWKDLIARETAFKFFTSSKDGQEKIYRRIQELKQLSEIEINLLAKARSTSDNDLQIIINVPCLLERLDNEALAMHFENFVVIAEHMIEHPEKATLVEDIHTSIMARYPWLKSAVMSSPLAQLVDSPRLRFYGC